MLSTLSLEASFTCSRRVTNQHKKVKTAFNHSFVFKKSYSKSEFRNSLLCLLQAEQNVLNSIEIF
jgi:hypothetical protein